MHIPQQILSDITVHMKYAKYIPELGRRETWTELVDRNKAMHLKKYPHMTDEIEHAYKWVYAKKVLPSMRSMQFAGKPIELNNARIYNCSASPISNLRAFSESMFLLLGGTGYGFSVQRMHIDQLPPVVRPTKEMRFVVGDSIEGWSDAVKALVKAYLGGRKTKPKFDFRDIRPKGARLITSGGKAPGPQPLKTCLHHIEAILDAKENGEKLRPIEVFDIICHIADAVLAGGIRRAALICLFDSDDEEMLSAKSGNWWELNPQRGRANISAVVYRDELTEEAFRKIWKRTELSGAGEPGVYLSNSREMLTNPCVEIGLKNDQFCNTTEINADTIEGQEDFNQRARVAAFLGTLQAGYTDLHYLDINWKETTEEEALLGVSLTGICGGAILSLNESEAAREAVNENVRVADLIGINRAARVTTIKPAGTTSLVFGCSSGIHAWFAPYYIRRMRVGKNEAIYQYLKENHPTLVEDEAFRPTDMAVISIPQKAPEGAIFRTESAVEMLERVKRFYENWILPGHISGPNTHNVSATVNIKPEEWAEVTDWAWENRESYLGLASLPYDGGTYVQAPFEEIDEDTYNNLIGSLEAVDLSKVIELDDNTDLTGELACGGGGCEVT